MLWQSNGVATRKRGIKREKFGNVEEYFGIFGKKRRGGNENTEASDEMKRQNYEGGLRS